MLPRFVSKALGRIDPEEFNAYRSVIPSSVFVHIEPEGKSYIITIKSMDDKKLTKDLLISQGRNDDEIIDAINDLVLMYRNVPEVYRPYFKRILTPEGQIKKQKELVLVKS
jgi:hypothetical protein